MTPLGGHGLGDRITISEVSQILGIPVPTIRSWERRYSFPSPARTGGQHRRYTTEEIESLRAVRDGITRGHAAREAVSIVRSAQGSVLERNRYLDEFTEGAALLDPGKVRRSLEHAASKLGVEQAIEIVVLPGMREMGDRWRAGRCDVANEHLATEVVRRWLAGLMEAAPPPHRRHPVVLACGPEEMHTIGLEAFAVVLRRRGWSCNMLGARTPPDALVATVRAANAACAVVTAQRSVGRRGAIASLAAVDAIPGVDAFFGGTAFAAVQSREGVSGIYLGDDLVPAADLLSSTIR